MSGFGPMSVYRSEDCPGCNSVAVFRSCPVHGPLVRGRNYAHEIVDDVVSRTVAELDQPIMDEWPDRGGDDEC